MAYQLLEHDRWQKSQRAKKMNPEGYAIRDTIKSGIKAMKDARKREEKFQKEIANTPILRPLLYGILRGIFCIPKE